MNRLLRKWKLVGMLDNLTTPQLIAFSILSFNIWLISLALTKFNVNDFGIFTNLSGFFYLSVLLLQFSFFYKLFKNKNYKVLLWIDTIILIGYLFLTPIILEGTPRVANSWYKYGFTDFIVRNNVLEPTLMWYHNWPVLHIFSAIIVEIMNVSPETFLLYFPISIHLVILPILVVLLSYIFKDNRKIWIGVWVFYFANWVNQDHFTAQNLGLLLYIFILALVIKFFVQKEEINQRKIIFVLFLLLLTLILTHLLTTIILCLNLIVLILFFEKSTKLSKKYVLYGIVIIFASILFWYYFAQQWVSLFLESSTFDIVHLGQMVNIYLSKITGGNLGHRIVIIIRILFTGLIFICAFLGTILASKSYKKLKINMWLLVLCAALPIPFILYGGEILERFFLFSLFPVSVLISMGINRRKLIIIAISLLIVSTPFHIITHYGNEKIDYISPSEIAGANFFFDRQLFNGTILASNSAEGYLFIEKCQRLRLSEDVLNVNGTQYVWITSSWKNHLEFYYGDTTTAKKVEEKVQEQSYNKIYANPDFELYLKNGE